MSDMPGLGRAFLFLPWGNNLHTYTNKPFSSFIVNKVLYSAKRDYEKMV